MWRWNDGTMELYHYGVKGMKWGVRKKRILNGIGTGLKKAVSDKARSNNEKFSDQLAYRTGGSDAVKRNQAKRQRMANQKKSVEYRKASGKKRVEMIMRDLGNQILEGPKDVHGNSHNKTHGNI